MTWPALNAPFAFDADTELTVGALVSIAMFLFAPREPAAPGWRACVALLAAASMIVPLLRVSAPVSW